jgi:hypothetical protein
MSHPDPLFDPDNSYEDDIVENENDEIEEFYDDSFDDSMDGDAESAFGSCGWAVDEYYNPDCGYGDDW